MVEKVNVFEYNHIIVRKKRISSTVLKKIRSSLLISCHKTI